MKTTEIFVEQVLIGFLVLFTGALMFSHEILEFIGPRYISIQGKDVYDSWRMLGRLVTSTAGKIVIGAVFIGIAYLVGIVYDRIADTLLEDFERHHRLIFGLKPLENRLGKIACVPRKDVFPEHEYRIGLLKNDMAIGYANYLRSRIRLTRALTTLVPAMSLSLLLVIIKGEISESSCNWWYSIPMPIIYALVFFLKSNVFSPLPKTGDLERLRGYMEDWRYLGSRKRRPPCLFLMRDLFSLTMLVLIVCSIVLVIPLAIFSERCSLLVLLLIPIGGGVLALVVGWSWWRISQTFFLFLADFHTYYTSASQPR